MNKKYRMADHKEHKKYLRSEENLNRCKPFDQLCEKYVELQKQYGDAFHELYDDISLREHRREYANGRSTMHRGYYSPSTSDLYVGGCNRGKLLKSPPKGNNYDYEYIFDENNKMICCKKYWLKSTGEFFLDTIELFVYEDVRVLSFVYSPNFHDTLSYITECQYKDDKLVRYESVLCNLYRGGSGCDELNVEVLAYEDGLMKTVYWYRYSPLVKILNEKKYTFSRDEEGYLTTYTVEELDSFACKCQRDEPITYNVLTKRK